MAEAKETTPWLASRIKLKGTPEVRKTKYALAREFGAPPSWAQRIRDWHSPKIFRTFGKEVPSLQDRRAMGLLGLGFGLLLVLHKKAGERNA